MAMDGYLYDHNPTTITSRMNASPRISFSQDLSQADVTPVENHNQPNSSSTVDFDFCVFRGSFDQESSLADEFFLDGKILPIQIKKRLANAPPKTVADPPLVSPPSSPPPPPPQDDRNIKSAVNKKLFWPFKRSNSLNCSGNGGGYGRRLCPLTPIPQCNSTGCAKTSKRSSMSKCSLNHKQQTKSLLFGNWTKQSQPDSSGSHQKPPLKINKQNSHGINPVFSAPNASLLGMCSLFLGGKDKNKSNK